MKAAYAAMLERAVDGYQAQRTFLTSDGSEVHVNFWGRRVDCPREVCGLWFLVSADVASRIDETYDKDASVVLALTDHDWQIRYMSADADLLGCTGSELRGFPLIGLIHPSVATEFLVAAHRAASEDMSVTIRTRMRMGKDSWADRYCLLVRMCEHHPPRLGVVITAGGSGPGGGFGARLEEEFRHSAFEYRATAAAFTTLPGLGALPPGSELSARQTKIVALLVAGEGVPDIARVMYLSPSTVRNHLAAIYRKFGVHSQSELLAALLREAVAEHS